MRGFNLLMGLAGIAASVSLAAQTAAPSPAPAAKPAVAVTNPSVASAAKTLPNVSSQPLWKELTAAEQTALRPLAANWDSMGIGQKRKWQTVAKDFDKLPAAQQTKMHARMAEWTALSSQQRAAARINFAQNRELTDGLTPEQRKVQWEAYQQLSPEEKRKLAESAPKAVATGAAPAARPQPVLKKDPRPEFGTAKVLAKAKSQSNAPAAGKKIAVAPHVAEHGSILRGEHAEPAEKP
jgi:Protein of unknown function (DUF3106)